MMKHIPGHAILAVAALFAAGTAQAQEYPIKSIRYVVPFPAGGGGDIIIRTMGQKLTERLGQNVLVDNRAGAGGNLGSEIVARSPGDGYTLLMANVAPMAINVSVYDKLPYDPVSDFTHITLLATFPNVLVVHPSLPARTLQELGALAKSKPGQLTYASAGSGSTTHLAGEFFRSRADINLLHIPYKGGGPALVDVIAGQVTMYFSSLPGGIPHIRNGRLRALGVTGLERSPAAPEIPAIAEIFPGFEAVTWIGCVGPAGIPRPIVNRLNAEIVQIMKLPDVREKLVAQGADPVTNTPEQFTAYVKSEIAKWSKVVKDAGIRAQ
jgi:tripartite-type tricarboxylate transporter receptor subunit TctC